MTQLRSLRLVCLAPGERAPLLPGGFEHADGVHVSARAVEDFLAELDAGGALPDAVLAFDGARVAALLRRHERCALLMIFSFGPPDAAVPPGCDAVLAEWSPDAAERARARASLPPLVAMPARDSERRAQRFAHWLAARGRADELDAAAFGVEAPHTLLAAWRAEGRVVADPAGGWRPTTTAQPLVSAPRDARALTAARSPGRYGWPALLLILFALLVMQGEGWLGGRVGSDRRHADERGLVIGDGLAAAGPAVPVRVASSPDAELAESVVPLVNPSHMLAFARARRAEERVLAAGDGVLKPIHPAEQAFAAGELLARIEAVPAPPLGASEASVRAARERLALAEERYARRRALATEGVLAWREVAPDWEELEAARAELAAGAARNAGADPSRGGEPPLELRARTAGVELIWLAPPGAAVRAGDEVLCYSTMDAWLELELEPDEWASARMHRIEARFGAAEMVWHPVQVVGEAPHAGGGVRLSLLAPGACVAGPPPPTVELRWSAR